MRGRLRESDSLAVELRARNVARGASVDPIGLASPAALDDAFLRGQSQRGVAELDSAIRANPFTPARRRARCSTRRSTTAIAGAPDRARAILAQYDATARDSVNRQAWRGQRLYTEGNILLAERRTDERSARSGGWT